MSENTKNNIIDKDNSNKSTFRLKKKPLKINGLPIDTIRDITNKNIPKKAISTTKKTQQTPQQEQKTDTQKKKAEINTKNLEQNKTHHQQRAKTQNNRTKQEEKSVKSPKSEIEKVAKIDSQEPQNKNIKKKNNKQNSSNNKNNNKDTNTNNELEQIRKKAIKIKETLYTHISDSKRLTKSQSQNNFLKSFLCRVEDYLTKKAFIEPGGKILAAVSGGVDSIVLMDALGLLASKIRFSLYVAHFNHKLRGLSSDKDEQLVRNACKDYNIHFYSGSGNVRQYSSKNGISIEHAARILRYNFFERTARNVNVDIVSTAHNLDDLVETFFINLFRGSGLTGLSSMPSKRKFVKNVTLVRPFLQFSKSELYKYAKIRKLAWSEDETNALLNYTRNKIRHDLLPKLINEYNPSIISVINRTSELLQGADEVIKDIVIKNSSTVIEEGNNDRFSMKINMLLTFNKFMQGELIQYAWNKYFRLLALPLATIDRILELIDKQTGSICEVSSGFIVLKDRNNLIFSRVIKEFTTATIIEKLGNHKIGKYRLLLREIPREEMKFSNDKFTEYIDAEAFDPYFEIRNKKDGDYFYPLGAPGEMKLSDFLTNSKVSLIDKSNILVLTNKIDILWVIGHRISDKYKVRKDTKRILLLKFISTDK